MNLIDERIIRDSQVLSPVFDDEDNLQDLEDLKINLTLIRILYDEEYDFTKDELVELVKDLDFIASNKLKSVAFLLKFNFGIPEEIKNENILKILNDIQYNSDIIYEAAVESGVYDVFVNYYTGIEIDKMLILSSEHKNPSIVKFLLDLGANIHIENDLPLKSSSKNGNFEVVKLLLDKSTYSIPNLELSFSNAAKMGHLDVVKLFLSRVKFTQSRLDRALSDSCQKFHLDVVRILLDHGSNIRSCNSGLQTAARIGRADVVKFILDLGFDVHIHDDFALLNASECGHLEVVKIIVNDKANLNICNAAFKNSLIHGHLNIVQFFIERGLVIDFNSTLQFAARKGYLDLSRLFLECGADINADDDRALCEASSSGHVELVKFLIESGANIHADDDCALRETSVCGRTEVVKLLIKNGANIHALNDCALCEASYAGHIEVVKLLLPGTIINNVYIALWNAASKERIEVFELILDKCKYININLSFIKAAKYGFLEALKILLNRGANIHYSEYDSENNKINDAALIGAVKNGHLHVVEFLISHGSDVNSNNNLALITAINECRLHIVKFLLDIGSDINYNDDEALCVSLLCNEYLVEGREIIELLVERGANINAREGLPLNIAVENCDMDIIRFLLSEGSDVLKLNNYSMKTKKRKDYPELVELLLSYGSRDLTR